MAHILIVDEDPAFRATLREALEQAGHSVVEAGNGLEATKIMESISSDIVITDMVMPEMDGIELVRYIHSTWPNTKIIAVTTDGGAAYLRLVQQLGADLTAVKTSSPNEVLNMVNGIAAYEC